MMRVMTQEEIASTMFDEIGKLRAENARLTHCLFAIKDADPSTTIEAIQTVAYDVAMNCITPEIAEHQLRVRSGLPSKP